MLHKGRVNRKSRTCQLQLNRLSRACSCTSGIESITFSESRESRAFPLDLAAVFCIRVKVGGPRKVNTTELFPNVIFSSSQGARCQPPGFQFLKNFDGKSKKKIIFNTKKLTRS